jgi:hypothetical protein
MHTRETATSRPRADLLLFAWWIRMMALLSIRRVVTLLFMGFAVSVSWAQSGNPGQVFFGRLASPDLNAFTNSPSLATEQWFQAHFFRMGVYTPYFDTRTSWFPNSLVYQNLYGIQPGSWVQWNHPEWILHDQYGNWLYVPWNCNGGTCPSYAGDIANPAFRAWWISQAQNVLSHGYLGLWIDDVNMEFRVSDGWGNQISPVDSTTGQLMTWDAWRVYVASFVQQIRQAFPSIEIMHNTIWFAGPQGIRDADASIKSQISAANNLNLERGIGSDPGLTGGTGDWSVYALFAYIDRVHALGRGITIQEYVTDNATQQYSLAGYFLISSGLDRIGDGSTNPSNWWSGYDVKLGTPLGPRTYNNGVFQRSFTGGMVLLGEPGLPAQTITLPGTFTTLSGQNVNSVTLSGRQGIILIGPGGGGAGGGSVTHYVSDLTPTYSVNGWGLVQYNLSNGGNTISLNGVKYTKGLGVHAYAEQRYQILGNCSNFAATVGIDDEIPPGYGSVAFQVWGDGFLLYNSGTISGGSPAVPVNVNVSGRQSISLVVTNGTYMAPSWTVYDDHADWANATLTCSQ